MTSGRSVLLLALALTFACCGSALAGFNIFSVGGTQSASSIQPTVDAFRAALGNPNNGNAPGPLASGRREINWDGGGATTSTPGGVPFTTFQNTRGATFTTAGSSFLQTPVDDLAFTTINPTYSTTFGFFSPIRIFTALGSNVVDTTFAVPGTNGATAATVAGFGAVFSDVDLANTTSLQFFDLNDQSLGMFSAPVGTTQHASLSFIGAIANAGERIARVRITSGNFALGPNDNPSGEVDVAVMDDFLYAEPVAVPEASAAVAIALIGSLQLVKRRCRS